VTPFLINTAIKINVIARNKLEAKIMRCLENRSNRVPTNGPISEYGNKTTLKAKAAVPALGWRSGENKTKEASADWKRPSVNCPIHRTANNFFTTSSCPTLN